MTEVSPRLYHDLAWLWPYWGDVEEYRPESELFARLIQGYSRIPVHTILDMGCGGGKHAYHLKGHFQLTGIDISPEMLAMAGQLNPDCEFLLGDMRSMDLSRQFDAVFINDSITYMKSPDELRSVFRCAFQHLREGGVVITSPDHTRESFIQNLTQTSPAVTRARPANLDVVFVENYYDPDPEDDTCEFTLVCLMRENGRLRIEQDVHVVGLFALEVWREALRDTGFEIHEASWEGITGPGEGLPVFVGIKPGEHASSPGEETAESEAWLSLEETQMHAGFARTS